MCTDLLYLVVLIFLCTDLLYLFTRSKSVNFYIEKCSSNSKLHSFSYRSRRYWNSLSKITKEARDLNSFKNLLDKDPNRFISYYEYDN